MKSILIYFLAFTGGILLSAQAGFNTQLGTLLKQPLLAVITTSVVSAFFGAILLIIVSKGNIQIEAASQIPGYLWFTGGLFSMLGISIYFYIIPILGISNMIALGLCGQLIFSMVAGQYGILNLPVEPITTKRFIGTVAMLIGIILINTK